MEEPKVSIEKYRDIREEPNFIYLYYINSGGVLQDEQEFIKLVSLWCMRYHQMPFSRGVKVIINYLDNLYEYKK